MLEFFNNLLNLYMITWGYEHLQMMSLVFKWWVRSWHHWRQLVIFNFWESVGVEIRGRPFIIIGGGGGGLWFKLKKNALPLTSRGIPRRDIDAKFNILIQTMHIVQLQSQLKNPYYLTRAVSSPTSDLVKEVLACPVSRVPCPWVVRAKA